MSEPSAADSRVVRVFVSSTFRDFEAERDLLARRVFPELRQRAAALRVEVTGIDLRWGITDEQSERGETLPICLAEIDRCRPYFVGLLGERHGWVPPPGAFHPGLLEAHPWLGEQCDGRSVTELEILHGVLNRPGMQDRAVMCIRDREWSEAHGFGAVNPSERARADRLKDLVRGAGCRLHRCADPEGAASVVLEELWAMIEADFPAEDAPSAAEWEDRLHRSFAVARRRGFVGRKAVVRAIVDPAVNPSGCVVRARSGGGKSAVLAVAARACASAGDAVFEHYLGASGPAGSLHALLSRLHSWIDVTLGVGEPIASESDLRTDAELAAALPGRLHALGQSMASGTRRATVVIDALDRLADDPHLTWFPDAIPGGVRIIGSTLDPRNAERTVRSGIRTVVLEELSVDERMGLLGAVLAGHGKRMPEAEAALVTGHPLAGFPLFVRTAVSELCVCATHETLADRVREICAARTMSDAFLGVLRRVQADLVDDPVESALAALRCSRDGMSEQELREFVGMAPASWARIRAACAELLLESDGRIRLRHAHVADACDAAWMPDPASIRACHSRLGGWWRACGPSVRAAFELPWQLVRAGDDSLLRELMLERDWFAAVLATRPEVELLGWLASSGMGVPASLERAIEERWVDWAHDLDDQTRGRFAQSVGGFLGFATAGCPFAVTLLRESVDCARRAGIEGEALAIRLNNMGHELLAMSNPREAVEAFEQCLEIRRVVLARTHPHAMATLDNLGQGYAAAGDMGRAIERFREALDLRREVLGDSHPDACTSKNNLAMTLIRGGRPAEAGALLREAHRDTLARLGPDHPDTGISAGNLGSWHAMHGDRDEGIRLLKEAVEIHRRALGDSHPYVEIGLARLGSLGPRA